MYDDIVLPDLDEMCSEHLCYRDFVECSQTWRSINSQTDESLSPKVVSNIPQQLGTYQAIAQLSQELLEPIISEFGDIGLTYGFACPQLTRHIKRGIAPKLDQHAGCELRRDGNLVCPRKGMAVDFMSNSTSSLELAHWIVEHLPFDALYFYGDSRPVHIAWGESPSKRIYTLIETPRGRRPVRGLH